MKVIGEEEAFGVAPLVFLDEPAVELLSSSSFLLLLPSSSDSDSGEAFS